MLRYISLLGFGGLSLLVYGCAGTAGEPGQNGEEGSAGISALVTVGKEAAGKHCATGGSRIDFGADADSDGSLSASEIEGTQYVCAGAQGTDGATGTNGTDGVDGASGTDGVDGIDGIDGVDGTNGVDGSAGGAGGAGPKGDPGSDGFHSLLRLTDESGGSNCASGGKKIEAGLDNGDGGGVAADGVLDDGEVDNTQYLCAVVAEANDGGIMRIAGGAAQVSDPNVLLHFAPSGNLVNDFLFAHGLNTWSAVNGGNGWAASTGGGLFGGYVLGSYNYGELSQVVDLTTVISPADLDARSVPLNVGVFAGKGGWAADIVKVRAEYLDQGGTLLASESLFDGQTNDPNPTYFGGTSSTYPVGTRKVRLVFGTDDGEYWAGHYAAHFQVPSVVPGARLVRFSIDGGSFGAWETFSPHKTLALTGLGVHKITAQISNSYYKSIETVSDTVELVAAN